MPTINPSRVICLLVVALFGLCHSAPQASSEDVGPRVRVFRIDEFEFAADSLSKLPLASISKDFDQYVESGDVVVTGTIWLTHCDGNQSRSVQSSASLERNEVKNRIAERVFDGEIVDSKKVVYLISETNLGDAIVYTMQYESTRLEQDEDGSFNILKNSCTFKGKIVEGQKSVIAGSNGPAGTMLLLSVEPID